MAFISIFDLDSDLKNTNLKTFYLIFVNREIVLKKGENSPLDRMLNKEDFVKIMECANKENCHKSAKPEIAFFEPEYNYVAAKIDELPAELSSKASDEYETAPIQQFFADELSVSCRVDTTSGNTADSGTNISISFIIARAKSLSDWRKSLLFCPTCGTPLTDDKTLSCKVCPQCKKQHFPRIEPCVIVLVKKDGKMLLARHKNRNNSKFVCLSGFIEAGESAEEAVKREVMEETGLSVKNISYKGSQSWPFPDQLMLAFEAEWESGEIKLQEDEIEEAVWFDQNNPPSQLTPGSVAYKLINGISFRKTYLTIRF